MTDNIIAFPDKKTDEPVTSICEMKIMSDGSVSVWITGEEEWSTSRYNWVLAQIALGSKCLLDWKAEHIKAKS